MPTITAARVALPEGIVGPAVVAIEGGVIESVTPGGRAPLDVTLAPGFVDVQVNGIDGVNVTAATGADWPRLDEMLLSHGVTAWCPTLTTAPMEAYATPLASITAAAQRTGPVPAILGAHLEGPFLGGAPGAHRVSLIRPVDLDWIDALPPIVRIMTMAPEVAGFREAADLLRVRGVVVAMGHSTAPAAAATAGADAGATLVTHCFNGMGPFHQREPGLIGVALTDDRLAVSVIADLVHVHPVALRLAFAAKPAGMVVIVTDAVAGAGTLPDGTLAGGKVPMDAAVGNAVAGAGVSVDAAIRAASTAPCDLLGDPSRGRVAPGSRADLVALDADLRARTTWVGGVEAWTR